jgi:hypothetical protein
MSTQALAGRLGDRIFMSIAVPALIAAIAIALLGILAPRMVADLVRKRGLTIAH